LGKLPPLRALHPDSSLSQAKLNEFEKIPTDKLIDSLRPGQDGELKARADGTVVDGHHRVRILQRRGVDVDALPRTIVEEPREL
jgi:hypothetical protein